MTIKMKILFLDIDGVCNCAGTKERVDDFIGFDPVMVSRVQRIIKETGCEVVLSSMWRITERSRDLVRKHVCNFIDITPSLLSRFRGDEIYDWLRTNSERDIQVERWAILDDDNDFHPEQPLFKTSWYMGLTGAMTDKVIKYLNGN